MVTTILCPCLFYFLPYNILLLLLWLVMFRMNTGSLDLDLRPGTVAKGQTGPWKVSLLPGHCVLEACDHRVNKLSVGSLGQPIQRSVFVCVCLCVCVCVCARVKLKFGWARSKLSQLGTNVCVTRRDEIFITGYNLQACMCWRCERCLNTSHQYHFPALPLTGISVPSEEINVLNCPWCIFMPVYYNDDGQNQFCITKLTRNANRQNDFDIISLTMTLPT